MSFVLHGQEAPGTVVLRSPEDEILLESGPLRVGCLEGAVSSWSRSARDRERKGSRCLSLGPWVLGPKSSETASGHFPHRPRFLETKGAPRARVTCLVTVLVLQVQGPAEASPGPVPSCLSSGPERSLSPSCRTCVVKGKRGAHCAPLSALEPPRQGPKVGGSPG